MIGLRIGVAIAAVLLGTVIANADVAVSLNWCWSNKGEPVMERQFDTLPDGTRRGPESAHGILLRAKQLLFQGKNALAVEMAAACQAHNSGARREIENNPEEAIRVLKSLK